MTDITQAEAIKASDLAHDKFIVAGIRWDTRREAWEDSLKGDDTDEMMRLFELKTEASVAENYALSAYQDAFEIAQSFPVIEESNQMELVV